VSLTAPDVLPQALRNAHDLSSGRKPWTLLAGSLGGVGPHASPSTREQGAAGSEADVAADEGLIDVEGDEQEVSDESYEEDEDDADDDDETEDESEDEELEGKAGKKRARDPEVCQGLRTV